MPSDLRSGGASANRPEQACAAAAKLDPARRKAETPGSSLAGSMASQEWLAARSFFEN
jgi:hypothetical protein